MLEKARWVATAMVGYDRDQTMAIVNAIGARTHELAGDFAVKAVEESGFGIPEYKKIKSELTSIPLIKHYRDKVLVNPVFDKENSIIEIHGPTGVIFALTPSTNPIAIINFKTIFSLMTRNAIVISPHPAVKKNIGGTGLGAAGCR